MILKNIQKNTDSKYLFSIKDNGRTALHVDSKQTKLISYRCNHASALKK